MWAYGTKFNVGMLTHQNGMYGMRGMRAYSTKSNVRARGTHGMRGIPCTHGIPCVQWHAWYAGALTHRNGTHGMRGMRACVTHRNGMLGMSRMLELTRFF